MSIRSGDPQTSPELVPQSLNIKSCVMERLCHGKAPLWIKMKKMSATGRAVCLSKNLNQLCPRQNIRLPR